MARLLLATKNPGKLRELREMTAGGAYEWVGLADFPDAPDAIEDGDSFFANAAKKARFYAQHTGLPALADDSGLEVDALGGAPGVDSAHYAGPQRDDAANNAKLIAALANVPTLERTARFRCAMVLARDGEILAQSEGAIEGCIVDTPRGDGGFGYDPHFFLPHLGCTTAELSPARKNELSHRGQALRAMLAQLERLAERL